jgi:diguanylate cyclase
MSFIQRGEKNRVAEISKSALDYIQKLELLATPETYEVWFTYYARSRPDLIRAIDNLFEKKAQITDLVCSELYNSFLSDYKNEDRIRQTGEQLQDTITSVSDSMLSAKNVTHNYSQKLVDIVTKLNDSSPEDAKKLIQDTSKETESIILENQKLEEQLKQSTAVVEDLKKDLEFIKREAITDGLTGLSNRKAFDEEIEKIILESKAENKTFTLLIIDIDHFKQFNDKYGHQVGDQVLKLVARTLKDSLKGRDFAARYGGEEFAILLPETPKEAAIMVGNSLRKALAGKDVVNRTTGDVLGRITMSIGVAEFAPDATSEILIERADKALYEAKNAGRNQVVASL